MKDYKRLTKRCGDIVNYAKPLQSNFIGAIYEEQKERDSEIMSRLADLEDKIESGEIDYVADSKTEQTITDLLIEFDEMGFAPTTVCPNLEQYATEWRERVRKEFARLTAENAELRATLSKMETVEKELRERLEKAVELPPGDRVWYIAEDEEGAESYIISKPTSSLAVEELKYEIGKKYFTTREAAEKRLAELKGEKK